MSQDHHIQAGFAGAVWRASSYSGGQGNCVEVAPGLGVLVPVRDSKWPAGPALAFSGGAWAAFVEGLRGAGRGGQ